MSIVLHRMVVVMALRGARGVSEVRGVIGEDLRFADAVKGIALVVVDALMVVVVVDVLTAAAAVVVVVDALIGAVVVVVSGCWFAAIAMSSQIRVDMDTGMSETRSILIAPVVRISINRVLLHPRLLQQRLKYLPQLPTRRK
jgi:hypothetical protein